MQEKVEVAQPSSLPAIGLAKRVGKIIEIPFEIEN
jgi:hypothetical protein